MWYEIKSSGWVVLVDIVGMSLAVLSLCQIRLPMASLAWLAVPLAFALCFVWRSSLTPTPGEVEESGYANVDVRNIILVYQPG